MSTTTNEGGESARTNEDDSYRPEAEVEQRSAQAMIDEVIADQWRLPGSDPGSPSDPYAFYGETEPFSIVSPEGEQPGGGTTIADARAQLEQLPQTDTLERGMVLYDIAKESLVARSALTNEATDSDSILRECNRIMVLNGYPDANLEGRSNITMADLPRAWNGVRWDQEFKLYDDAALDQYAKLAAEAGVQPAADESSGPPAPPVGPDMAPDVVPDAAPDLEPQGADVTPQPEVVPQPEVQPGSAEAEPTVAAVNWDPQLDEMNASLEHPQGLKPGDKYWRLVAADFMPAGNGEGESGGRHHILYNVLDENGNPIVGAGIAMAWPDGQSNDVTKPDDGGRGNQAMYASFAPDRGESGSYSAFVTANGLPSDRVNGLGLPLKEHVSYNLTFQLATWGGESEAQPEQQVVPPEQQVGPAGEQPGPPAEVVPAGDGRVHMTTADGYQADMHPDLNLDLRGFTAISGLPPYNSDTGPVDQNAPQLASLFGSSHPTDDQGLPRVSNLYRVNDWQWNDSIPKSEGRGTRGGPITNTEVTMLGFETTPGEPIYLPDSGYRVDGQGREGQILYLDREKGEITIAYNLSGTVAGGYTVHIRGVDFDPYLSEGGLVGTDGPLGTARGGELQVAMTDRGTFMDIRHTNHWWQRRDRHR
jgi:hypothetical protein